MFVEFFPGMSRDMTYCTAKTCPIKECGRHPAHHPPATLARFMSIADFEPVCRAYIGRVLEEVERK